jgi:hypothetical protein
MAPVPPPDGGMQRFRGASTDEDEETPSKGRTIAIAIVLVLLALVAAALVFRDQIEAATGISLRPPAQTEQAEQAAPPQALPQPPPQPANLELIEVESSIEETDGVSRLIVKGLIVNPGDTTQRVPQLSFEMVGTDGRTIDRWVFSAPVDVLEPHGTTRFLGQRETPPPDLKELIPGFVQPGAAGTPPEVPPQPDASAPEAPAS